MVASPYRLLSPLLVSYLTRLYFAFPVLQFAEVPWIPTALPLLLRVSPRGHSSQAEEQRRLAALLSGGGLLHPREHAGRLLLGCSSSNFPLSSSFVCFYLDLFFFFFKGFSSFFQGWTMTRTPKVSCDITSCSSHQHSDHT